MNDVKEIGRVANSPELSYTNGGVAVAHFDIAVQRKTSDRNAPPNYFPVTCWGHTAEFAEKHITKGRLIAISGHLETNRWKDKHDQNRKDVYIVADNIEPLDSPRAGAADQQPAGEYTGGDYYDGVGYEGP